MGLWRTTPDPGRGVAIEMRGGDLGHISNVMIISQRLPGEGFAPKDAPPALNQVEPGRAHWNEGMLDARMSFEPLADRAAAVTRQVIGNQVDVSRQVSAVQGLEQIEVATGITGASRLGQDLPIADPQRPIHPDLLGSPVVVERGLDPVAIRRPARRWREITRRYRAEFVDTENGGSFRWSGVEANDRCPLGTKSGSLLLAHSRVWRQRTPSCRKMRRT